VNEKLQKVLARAGYGSRREIESWIAAGRVTVNGKPAQLGDRISEQDKVGIDGRPAPITPAAELRCRVLMYHKPEGEVCTRSDPEGRPTIYERLPRLRKGRWLSVGRLDLNTSGLVLLTTDGELANKLTHPSNEIEREYAVRVAGAVDADMLNRLQQGVMLEDGSARFDTIVDAGGQGVNRWYHVVLKEGRKREVRRLWESQGVKVSRLMRVRFGPVALPRSVRPGRWEELDQEIINRLLDAVGMEKMQPEKPRRRGARTPRRPAGKMQRKTAQRR